MCALSLKWFLVILVRCPLPCSISRSYASSPVQLLYIFIIIWCGFVASSYLFGCQESERRSLK